MNINVYIQFKVSIQMTFNTIAYNAQYKILTKIPATRHVFRVDLHPNPRNKRGANSVSRLPRTKRERRRPAESGVVSRTL